MSIIMILTPYHARFYAHELTRIGGKGVERLSRSLFDACVDLNPHQIEAALFAVRSPISKGVLLADEVGLGKTIEAGLVLCQYWAERKRKLLVICPASIRKQWAIELDEKFNLSSTILDAKAYKEGVSKGKPNPFDSNQIIITSLHFASRRRDDIRAVMWDLVVIDEAHKLRNAYRESNKMGQNIRWALEDRRKILLTATPLQNSLLELYGLSTLIDEHLFGDLPSFRTQYMNVGGALADLRDRLNSFTKRSLRSQVQEYIQFTERKLQTQIFNPSDDEHRLYEAISAFLQRDETYALPARQKHLTTLIVRKLLASSPRAVAGTLETMRDRLIDLREKATTTRDLDELFEDEEITDELLDELLNEENSEDVDAESQTEIEVVDKDKLNKEIEELERYIAWARSIGIDTKTRELAKGLNIGFRMLAEMGASQKAIIFTESRRTQAYLKDFLESNGYLGQVITFNGTNREPDVTEVYKNWVEENTESGRATGSRQVDVRTAIIEHFRNNAKILIATEAASEGVNLQFCSLVVNFDLPWNPQRIEQRIGRCHRYGQKYDVVVINFLNKRNHADKRVYELLRDKFNLFSGVFGVSDEVLGSIESGVDFEQRILAIYQECRTAEEIETAFKELQSELEESIKTRIDDTRKILLEHFDEDVHAHLRANILDTKEQLDRIGKMFWSLTKFILTDRADYNNEEYTFFLSQPPDESIRRGNYHLISKSQDNVTGEFLYRLSHPLGEYVVSEGKQCSSPEAKISFDITNHQTIISMVDALKGKSGWLTFKRLIIDSFDREEYLLFSGFDSNGQSIDQETCEKFFNCEGIVSLLDNKPLDIENRLNAESDRHIKATISTSLEENNAHFNEARDHLEKWADDMVIAVEKELKDTKEQIKALNREARKAPTMEEQHVLQENIKKLERKKRKQRQEIFDLEDEIIAKRDALIDALEKRMTQETHVEDLFTIAWEVI